jgi:HEAT repeat protein
MAQEGNREIYELLTGRIAPYAGEGETLRFDQIVRAPVDDETVGLVAQALVDPDPDTRRAGLFVFAGLQDETPGRLEPFRPLADKIRELLLDAEPAVRCDALMAFAYFDPDDLHVAVREFLTDPNGRNRLQAVRILDVERSPKNLPTLLTFSVDPYHEGHDQFAREWLVVREAARAAVERTADVRFPAALEEEIVEGIRCVYHAWDPVWQWAAKEGFRARG